MVTVPRNAFFLDSLRQVKATLNRYFAILIITVLGVAFFTGLRATGPDMRLTAQKYFNEHNFMDIRLLSTVGFNEDDITAIKLVEGVREISPSYSLEALLPVSDKSLTIRLHSLDTDNGGESGINRPRIMEGRFPQKSGECLADYRYMELFGFKTGDTVRFASGTSSPISDSLKTDTYVITGSADSPLYISLERGTSGIGSGKTDAFFYIPSYDFDMPVYTEVYITIEKGDGFSRYDDSYDSLIEPIKDALEKTGESRYDIRYEDIKREAREKLDDAKTEIEDGYRELYDAKDKLADARKELDDGWAEYYDGLNEFNSEIADARNKLNDGWKEYYDGVERFNSEIADARKKLDDGWVEYYEGLEDFNAEISKAQDDLNKARQELDDGWTEYYKGLDEFNTKISKAQKQLKDGWDAYYACLSEYQNGLSQYQTAYDTLQNAQNQLNEAYDEYNNGLAAYNDAKALYDTLEWAIANADTATVSVIAAQLAPSSPELAVILTNYANNPGNPIAAAAAAFATQQFGETLAETKLQLDAAKVELDLNQSEIDDGFQALIPVKTQLDEAKLSLNAARRELEEADAEFNKARADGQKKLDDALKALEEGESEYAKGLSTFEREKADGEQKLTDAFHELNDGEATLAKEKASGEQELSDAHAELKKGEKTLVNESADGKRKLAEAFAELADGEAEYIDGAKELFEEAPDALYKLSDAQIEVVDGEKELLKLEKPKWYVLDQEANIGFVNFEQDAERIDTISIVLPFFFFLISVLVSMTSMTRLVDSDRSFIGTYKALGYSNGQIGLRYLLYASSASLIGSGIGFVAGFNIFPRLILDAYKVMYSLPPTEIEYSLFYIVVSTATAVSCAALPAWFVCMGSLRESPASLMRPVAPFSGKRVFIERIKPLWKRLNFSQKVAMRNLFRYKKRLIMTVFGVAGSTALIFAGFGLRDSVTTIAHKQYGMIWNYDLEISFKNDAYPDEITSLHQTVDTSPYIASYTELLQESVDISSASVKKSVFLVVPRNPDEFMEFTDLHERVSRKPLTLDDNSVIITEKLAAQLGVSTGDRVFFRDGDDVSSSAVIGGIAENYILHYVYMTPGQYRSLFGKDPSPNQIICRLYDIESTLDLSESLLSESVTNSINFTADQKDSVENMTGALHYVVLVLIVSAAALVFVVLFSLTTINLEERRRELATLKVLGFFNGELAAYIYRENVMLTVFGTFIGLGLGVILQRYIITTMEINMVMFSRDLLWTSYVYSAGLTMFFAALVNIIMYRHIIKTDMVSSLKSVE